MNINFNISKVTRIETEHSYYGRPVDYKVFFEKDFISVEEDVYDNLKKYFDYKFNKAMNEIHEPIA